MAYRVETASSGRAVCRAKECKDAGVKIEMGDLRLGSWVPYEDHGSWHWKHWGCVTGAQIKNMRDHLANPATGGYNWDALDGYDGDEKNSLSHAPDLQDKVRKAIEQGHVDDEDFNGDIEMNKLGEKGLRTTANKRKILEAQRNRDYEMNELREVNAALQAQVLAGNAGGAPAKKKASAKKRARGDDDEEDIKPVKKGRAKKGVKKEESNSESDDLGDLLADLEASLKEEGDEKPAKKTRGKKAVKKEESEELDDVDVKANVDFKDEHIDEQIEEKPKPARKSRAKKAVIKNQEGETDDEAEVMPAPSKRSRAKKVVKKEEAQDDEVVKDEQVDELSLPAPKKSARGKKSVKNEGDEAAVKKEPFKRGGRKSAAKKEPDEDAVMADIPDIMDEAIKNEGVKNEESKDGVKDEMKGELEYRRYPEDHVKDELKHGLYQYDDLGELNEAEEEEDAPSPANRMFTSGRAPKKEKVAPKASTSTRATRSRTTKK